MIPIIPILASTAIGAGIVALVKYNRLSPAEKYKANAEVLELAKQIALSEFQREIFELSKQQQQELIKRARKQIVG